VKKKVVEYKLQIERLKGEIEVLKNMNPKFIIACDTLPGGTFDRDKLPAIREALKGYEHEIIDLFEFNSLEEAHAIRRGDIKKWFAKADLKKLNRKFTEKVFSSSRIPPGYSDMPFAMGKNILILGTLDLVSLFLFPETIKQLQWHMPVVCMFGDDEFMLNRHAHWVERFNKCVVYVKWCADYYNNIVPGSTYYLPWGCHFKERDFDKLQVPEKEKEYDVIFIGSEFGNRFRIVGEFNQHWSKCLRFKVFGGEDWLKVPLLPMEQYGGFLDAENIGPTIRKSKLTVVGAGDHLTGEPHMTGTLWAVIKEGQLPICSYYPVPIEDYGLGVPMFFESNVRGQVESLLESPGKRIAKARELFEKTKRDFDFVNLYRDLFQKIERDL